MSNFDINKSILEDPRDLRELLFEEVDADADLDTECTEGTDGVDSQVKDTGDISMNWLIVVDFDLISVAKGKIIIKL